MVYLIDTERDELKEVAVNGKVCPIIRHNQKLFEKLFPVMTVTDREEVTWYVCDFINFKDFKPKPYDIVVNGGVLYDNSHLEAYKTHERCDDK